MKTIAVKSRDYGNTLWPILVGFLFGLTVILHSTSGRSDDGRIIWAGGSAAKGVRVQLDNAHKDIDVTIVRDKDNLPKSIGMIFYDPMGRSTMVELKTMDPPDRPGHYQGMLSAEAGSFIGFEIRIPFGSSPISENATVFRSADLERLE